MNSALLISFMFLGQLTKDPDAPLPPREAPLRMTVPEGFKVTLFAGEPDVAQPIAFTFDDRGRLWVCECYSYPKWHSDPKQGKDRVVIFEDTDGDGSFDKRTVFADSLSNLSGIEYGFGGIWLCSLPNLIYIPIKAGEDRPAGPAEIKLDGWDLKSGHNVFSNLKWGPDGWLYGCNGIIATSKVGTPGTPEKDRVPINCGVWRYHPTLKKFEVYAAGTTNPWGLDWDEHGEMFITNCVIAHLWHVVPGAHFERMYGQDLQPNVYGLLKTCADHIHWGGGSWTSSRGGQGVHSEAGGGHAHVGCMIYQGDNWPERYRNGVFTCNLHGSRINHDILERNGSSYVARHGKDFLFANDPWFRGLALDYGPDGGVFVCDWTDTGECHNYKIAHTTTGRIYKIVYGKPEHKRFDLAKLNDDELVKLQLHKNEWFVRHARRILQERAARNQLDPQTADSLRKLYLKAGEISRLRIIWTLFAIRDLRLVWDLEDALLDRNEHVRAWGIRLVLDENTKSTSFTKTLIDTLSTMASRDPSPLVRLSLASGIMRMGPGGNAILDALVQHAEDASDPYLPLMYWYAIEPQCNGYCREPELLRRARIPLLREFIARRMMSHNDKSIDFLLDILAKRDSAPFDRDVLRGIHEAVKGRRSLSMPAVWKTIYPRLVESPLPEVREQALVLAVQFGDERASTALRKILLDERAQVRLRQHALETLLVKQSPDLVTVLQGLIKDPVVRGPALRGLGTFGDPKTPEIIFEQYNSFSDEEKADAVQTLSTRAPYALALLDAVEKKNVAKGDLSNFTVRQLQALKNKDVVARLNQVWGSIRPASADKSKLLAKYKQLLTADLLKKANKSNGRALYAKSCAACHRLFDEGGAIGPDITGAQRHNLDYILENIVDPSAVVQREFQVAVLTTTGGRIVTGIVKEESERAITLQLQNEAITLPRKEVESLERTKTSMMPDGMLDNLRPEEVRDLIAYLTSPVQVPFGKKVP